MKKTTFTLIFLLSISLFEEVFAQPGTKVKELFRDRYTVANGNYGHPYSIFDRNNGYSTEQTIQNLRVRLIKESDYQNDMDKPVFLAYKQVYDSAMLPRPVDDGMPNYGISRLALWAKSNAFVMLVGLNGNAYTLSLTESDFVKRVNYSLNVDERFLSILLFKWPILYLKKHKINLQLLD